MIKKTRSDGTYLSNLPHFTRLKPYLMGSRSRKYNTLWAHRDLNPGPTDYESAALTN